MDSLKNKVVIITGASSGIGAVLAQTLSEKGALVVLAARRLEKLHEVAKACPSETLCVQCDMTQDEERRNLVDATLRRWDRIDILVNNAGIGMYGDIERTNEEEIRSLFEVNVFAVIFLSRLVLPVMKRQNAGLILNIGSIGGLVAHSDKVTAYVASKHALVGFTRGLVKDLRNTGVGVKVVCPQLVETGFYRASIGADEMKGLIEKVRNRMDTTEQVVEGIVEQIFSEQTVIFPTDRSQKAYDRFRGPWEKSR